MYLVGMVGALGYDLPALAGHEVEQLVHQKGGGECLHPAPGYGDQLPAYRAPELRVPGKGGHDPAQVKIQRSSRVMEYVDQDHKVLSYVMPCITQIKNRRVKGVIGNYGTANSTV
jgi:hypothetical protein